MILSNSCDLSGILFCKFYQLVAISFCDYENLMKLIKEWKGEEPAHLEIESVMIEKRGTGYIGV